MLDRALKKKISELLQSQATLLWLEGAKYEPVAQVHMLGEKLAISLKNGTTRVVVFEKYATTSVGVQFWCRGRPCVLYKWDLTGITSAAVKKEPLLTSAQPEDDPPPPHLAA